MNSLATIAHPRLRKMAKVLESFRQIPVLQRRRLVEGVRDASWRPRAPATGSISLNATRALRA